MRQNVHLLSPPSSDVLDDLQSQLHQDIHLTWGETVPDTCHILVAGRPTRRQLTASPQLRALVIPWAGLPVSTRELLADFPDLTVHNLHHNAAPVAETAVTLLLAAAKLTIPFDRALRRHDWTLRYQRPAQTLLLAGKTALILGYGAIGERVARLCAALEMEVLATRRRLDAPTEDAWAKVYPAAALRRLLPQANALIVCLPLTPESEGLINGRALALLPPQAILVNIGRGPIVEEAALYAALQNGRLHAAGLDVWYSYPADEDARTLTPAGNFPFHKLDNVVMSPHRGGSTAESEKLRMAHLARLLNTAVTSAVLPNAIDLQAGY